MAKKKNQETRTKLEEINDSLSGIEQKFEQHKNVIYWAVMAVLVIALLIWGYFKFIYGPNLEKANNELIKADTELIMNQDSVAALKAYEKIAKNYSNDAGNVAKLKAATILYAQGKNKEALNYLEDYSPKGKIVGPASQSLLGDCYVNAKQLDKAVAAYGVGHGELADSVCGVGLSVNPCIGLAGCQLLYRLSRLLHSEV